MIHPGDIRIYLGLLIAQLAPGLAVLTLIRPDLLGSFLAITAAIHVLLVGAAARRRVADANNPYRK
jgi:hypothetical protein